MKKLMLLSLTLGLTFPGAHLLAGISSSKQVEKAEKTLPIIPLDVVTKEILTRILNEAFEQCDWKTIQKIALLNRATAKLVNTYITPKEKEIIKKYRTWLNNIESPHFLIDWMKGYTRSESSFHPRWLLSSVENYISYEERVKQIKQFIFVHFILNENVGLITARIIINLFLEHQVDLNIRYGKSQCLPKTGEQFNTLNLAKGSLPKFTILDIIKKENAPFTQSLAITEQEDYCPAIIRALKEAIAKQFILKSDLQFSELLDALDCIQNVEEPEGEHLRQLFKELVNRDFESFKEQFIQTIPHLQKSQLEDILTYIQNNIENLEIREPLEALIIKELEKRDTENNNNA